LDAPSTNTTVQNNFIMGSYTQVNPTTTTSSTQNPFVPEFNPFAPNVNVTATTDSNNSFNPFLQTNPQVPTTKSVNPFLETNPNTEAKTFYYY